MSEVWNIEFEDFVLPSKVSQATSPNILDTQRFSWSHEGERKDQSPSEVSELQLMQSSPSLGPSQSASQCHLPPVVSKYFFIPTPDTLPSPSKAQNFPSVSNPQPEMPEVPCLASSSHSLFEQARCPFSSQLYIGDMPVLDRDSIVPDDLDVVSEVDIGHSKHTGGFSESSLQFCEISFDRGLDTADGHYEFDASDYNEDTEPIYYIDDTFSCDGMSWTGNDDWLEDVDMAVEGCAFDASSGYADPLISNHRFAGEAQTEQYPSILWDDPYDAKSGIAAASLPFCQGKELLHGLSECGGSRTGFTITEAEAEVGRRLKSHWFPQKL